METAASIIAFQDKSLAVHTEIRSLSLSREQPNSQAHGHPNQCSESVKIGAQSRQELNKKKAEKSYNEARRCNSPLRSDFVAGLLLLLAFGLRLTYVRAGTGST